jgi:3-hydroxybutyryl-CoA dehydratase
MPVDPVCGMEVSQEIAEPTIEHDDEVYHFCSEDCRALFEEVPEKYTETPHPHLVESGGMTLPRVPYGRATGEFDLSITDPSSLSTGDSVRFSKTITDEDVRKFAEATGDTNAVHLNETFAEKTRFGHRIAHGTLVSGMISAALACFPGVTIYVSQSLEFRRPVSIDDTLTARCEITDVLDTDRYELLTQIENQSGKTVLDGSATVLIDPLPG